MNESAVRTGQGAHTGSPCDLCGLLRHPRTRSSLNHPLPTRLRVALVDDDERVHDFVRKAFDAHACGWILDSHSTARSALAALGFMPATPQPLRSQIPTSGDIPHSHAPPDELSTLPTINRPLDIPHPPAPPDVVLLEAELPGLSGLKCARRLIARLPNARIVMFTACTDHDTILESIMAGASDYLTKPVAPGYLVWAVSEAARGRSVLSGEAQAAVVDYIHRISASGKGATLSWREREVMLLLMKGAAYKEISKELGIEEGTVHRHLHDIYKKLGVHRKDEARREFAGGGVNLHSPGLV